LKYLKYQYHEQIAQHFHSPDGGNFRGADAESLIGAIGDEQRYAISHQIKCYKI